MFATSNVRHFRSGFRRPLGGVRSAFAIVLVSAFLVIPALAYAAKGTTIRAELAGPAGYCQYYDGAAAATVGKVQIATSPAATPGFHAVRVDIKMRPGQLPAGSYQVWLVNLYRDDAGQVIGCVASPFAKPMTVKSGGPIDFRGSIDRYSGEYELQVYVGPIWGPGYGTSPVIVDVP
jgi:hypothetical protein